MINPITGELFELPQVRSRLNHDRQAVSVATGLYDTTPTKTQQQFAEETDINTIVRRFGLTGKLPDNVRMPQYIDYEGVFDFQTAMNAVLSAEEAFMQLPADVRTRFRNDPQEFHDFFADDKNRDEAVRMGLVKPPPVVVATPAPPAPPAAPEGA